MLEYSTIKTKEDIEIYISDLLAIADEFINNAITTNPDALENRGTFPLLIQELSRYTKRPTTNKYNDKDIAVLDNLFNIYIMLVYKYKVNKRPSILEYSLMANIPRSTIDLWVNSINNENITKYHLDTIKKWKSTCEQSLLDCDNSPVMAIFQLKSLYQYRDNVGELQVNINQQNALTTTDLPTLTTVKPSGMA